MVNCRVRMHCNAISISDTLWKNLYTVKFNTLISVDVGDKKGDESFITGERRQTKHSRAVEAGRSHRGL